MKALSALLCGSVMALATAQGAVAQAVSDVNASLSVYMRDATDYVVAAERAKAVFAERYPNVTVTLRTNPTAAGWGGYITNMMNQVASGDSPDVVDMAIEGFLAVSSKGLLADLRPLFADNADVQKILADTAPALLTKMESPLTGELNYFPMEWNNIVIFYNKDMFDAAGVAYPENGWTWDDFVKTAQALTVTNADGVATQYGYRISGINFGVTPWFLVNGIDKLNADWTKSTVSDPAFSESLKFLRDLIDTYKVSPAFEAGVGDQEFAAKQVAMFSCGHWCVPGIQQAGLEHVGVVAMPVPQAGDEQVTVFGIGGLGVMKASAHPELALEFAQIFAGEDFQKDVSTNRFSIPSSRTWATTPEYLAYPDNATLFYDTAEKGQIIPIASPPNFAQVEDIFMRHLGSYLNGNADLESTVKDMDSELSRAMERAYR